MNGWFYALVLPTAVGLASVGYAIVRLTRLPKGAPAKFKTDGRPVVACIGSSTVHGHAGWDWVTALRGRRPQWAFMNGGLNGDLAWNVLQRLDPVLRAKPAAVVVLIGANDAMGASDAGLGRTYRRGKKLPEAPAVGFFERSLRELVERLQAESDARIGLATLVRIGGGGGSEVARQVVAHNEIIATVAAELGVDVLPLAEGITDDSGPAFVPGPRTGLRVVRACWLHYVAGWGWDRIADRRGSWAHVDTIHLSERAGRVVADVVDEWLMSGPDVMGG